MDNTVRLFEHEFIHAIQDEFFQLSMAGNYGSGETFDVIKYTLSDIEMNPLIVSKYTNYKQYLFNSGKEDSNEEMQIFINSNKYFKILKDKSEKIYRKMVKAFYDYAKKQEE